MLVFMRNSNIISRAVHGREAALNISKETKKDVCGTLETFVFGGEIFLKDSESKVLPDGSWCLAGTGSPGGKSLKLGPGKEEER